MKSEHTYNASTYKNCYGTIPHRFDLMKWINGIERFNHLVDRTRSIEDKKARNIYKKDNLPCITVSGEFPPHHREDKHIYNRTGFIALDFDNGDPASLKTLLSGIDNVFYAGLSVSGRGVWALVPLAFPEKHRQHFKALENDFKTLGVKIDPSCINESRLRYYSYDPEPYINPGAIWYKKLKIEKPPAPPRHFKNRDEKDVFTMARNYCKRKGLTFVDGDRHNYLVTFRGVCERAGVPTDEIGRYIDQNFIKMTDIKSNVLTYKMK